MDSKLASVVAEHEVVASELKRRKDALDYYEIQISDLEATEVVKRQELRALEALLTSARNEVLVSVIASMTVDIAAPLVKALGFAARTSLRDVVKHSSKPQPSATNGLSSESHKLFTSVNHAHEVDRMAMVKEAAEFQSSLKDYSRESVENKIRTKKNVVKDIEEQIFALRTEMSSSTRVYIEATKKLRGATLSVEVGSYHALVTQIPN